MCNICHPGAQPVPVRAKTAPVRAEIATTAPVRAEVSRTRTIEEFDKNNSYDELITLIDDYTEQMLVAWGATFDCHFAEGLVAKIKKDKLRNRLREILATTRTEHG